MSAVTPHGETGPPGPGGPPPGGSPPPSGGPPPASGGPPPASAAQAVPTVAQPVKSSAQNSGSSYVDKLKVNVNRFERLTRNVLEINLEKDSSVTFINLEPETVAKVLSNLGVDIKTQVEAVQTCPGNSKKIFVWVKPGVNIANFCKEESLKVSSGVRTGLIKPMDRKEVTVLIKGLNLNTPDTLVLNYLNLHGKVVSGKVVYDVERNGPLKGVKNGDRKYLVDFTNGINMSSYHLIDGVKVQVFYPGQRKTCGRCHKTALECPGKGFARDCNSPRVKLSDFMKAHWESIKFEPSSFVLAMEEDEDVSHADIEIKDSQQFTPEKPNNEQSVPEEKLTAVTLKNLPAQIPETEVRNFLFQHGLQLTQGQLKVVHNETRNTTVDVENIDAATCKILISNINEKEFFDKKLYCKALVEMASPVKATEQVDKPSTEASKDDTPKVKETSTPKSDIPGMTAEELKKNERKVKDKLRRKANKEKKELEDQEWKSNEKKEVKSTIPKKKPPKSKTGKPADGEIEDDEDHTPSDNIEKHFTFSNNVELSPKSQELLSPAIFNSRAAKTIQKEEEWKKTIKLGKSIAKRDAEFSPEDQRNTRARRVSTA
jgi:hypothetical protein